MRIIIDLDGTICELKKKNQTYADVRVLPGAAKKIKELRAHGHCIIIHTARHMKTCEGDISEVINKIGILTKKWLAENQIQYDELIFGKPHGDIYIDDLAHTFTSWYDTKLHKKILRRKTKK